MPRAEISDAEVLRTLRASVGRFAASTAASLEAVVAQLERARDVLRHELQPYWKDQARRRQEVFEEAKRRWREAEYEVARAMQRSGTGRPSSDEERRAMRKAQAKWEEALEKIEEVRRQLMRLDDDGDALATRCRDAARDLADRSAAAAIELEQRAVGIDAYHAARLAASVASAPPPGITP